nr:YdeI/OmpD-associated family protein [uncultured Draconibacterium sp.]
MQRKYFKNNTEWEKWLEQNHDKEKELFLLYYKKHTGKPCISYDDSVKTALCYGWIDGLVKRIDDESYTRRFTPRKENSVWSSVNKKRIAKLLQEGRMKPLGLRLVEAAKQNGNWERAYSFPRTGLEISDQFKAELNNNTKACAYFDSLSQTQQNHFIMWINTAKRPETKQKRIKESIELLTNKKKLGLK